MKINRTCCKALIGTEQEQINQLYEFVKALAGNYFEGFEIMGTYSPTVNYNKKYMLVFFEGSTYIKTVDGDSVNFSPALNPDKWALFSSGTPADLSDLKKVIEGSDTVVVDVNEAGTALEIHADYENIVKPLERALKKPVSNPAETVLAGVDARGEQVLLPVSSVGGGTKIYKYEVGGYFSSSQLLGVPDYDGGLHCWSGPFAFTIFSYENLEIPTFNLRETEDTRYDNDNPTNNAEKMLQFLPLSNYQISRYLGDGYAGNINFASILYASKGEYLKICIVGTNPDSDPSIDSPSTQLFIFSRYRVIIDPYIEKTEL